MGGGGVSPSSWSNPLSGLNFLARSVVCVSIRSADITHPPWALAVCGGTSGDCTESGLGSDFTWGLTRV